jgi:hypothetical protein
MLQLDLPSIHEKAWLASALSLAASCLSSSVISLGSAKLSVDSAGDGMTDEGGVVEEREGEDDSLMLTVNTPSNAVLALLYSILFVLALIRSGQTTMVNSPSAAADRHVNVEQSFRTKMTNNTHPMC